MTTFTAIDGSTVTPRTRADLMKHPAFADLGTDTDGNPCVWMNDYENEEGISWTDYWSTKCDDEGYPPILSVWRGRCSKWTDTMPREPDDDAYHLWASLPEKGDKEGEAAYGAMLASKEFAAQTVYAGRSITDWLESVQVCAPGMWENDNSATLGHWYAVCNDEGIIAYFGDESDALRFRLDYINRQMNP